MSSHKAIVVSRDFNVEKVYLVPDEQVKQDLTAIRAIELDYYKEKRGYQQDFPNLSDDETIEAAYDDQRRYAGHPLVVEVAREFIQFDLHNGIGTGYVLMENPDKLVPEKPVNPDENKNRGLYGKYRVQSMKDGKLVDGCFVLRPDQDIHARAALLAYAQSCERDNPRLADDLRHWMFTIEEYASFDPLDDSLDD